MNNILLVSHKEINLNPVFRQEQNVLELYNILKDNNNTEILYLHKIFDSNKDEENSISNIKQFSIRDIITKDLNGKQVKNFLKEHNINTIIFTSYHVAKIIMPYIESVIFDLNIICDFRLSNISYTLKEYKEEKDKDSYRLKEIKKDFKQQLIKLFVVFKYTDYIILDDYEDIEMLNDDNIKNKVITINNINDFINVKSTKKKIYYTVTNIVINKNNFLSNSISGNIKKTRDDEYIINNTKNLELINSLNEIIMNTKSDCFCIYNDKINISKII